jgi:hypothetical protein
VNATYLQNKVVSFGDSGACQLGSTVGTGGDQVARYEAGQPAWYFYDYKAIGVFQSVQDVQDYYVGILPNGKVMVDNNGNERIGSKQLSDADIAAAGAKKQLLQKTALPGDVKYADINKDGGISLSDKTNIGNPWPAWTYGINLSCEYKGFDFNAFFQGVQGNQLFYAILRGADHVEYNKPEYYYTDAWNGPGTSTTYPRASFDPNANASKNLAFSSLNVFSGNYIRLKNITLGYTLPGDLTKKVGISKLRIYTTAINLLTFTKYPGADPEVGQDINYQSNNQSYGVDRGLYPSSKTYNVGVNVTF